MPKSPRKQNTSPEIREEAMKIARANQRPGQSKEQTKLIAQGIQKGIEQYKKQQKSKARELDKKLKQVNRQAQQPDTDKEVEIREVVKYRQHWLPWTLLAASWMGIAWLLVAR